MSEKEFVVTASRSEYKGSPILELSSGPMDRWPLKFGLSKARRIVQCIEDIQKFVAEEEAKLAEKAQSDKKVAVK